MSETGLTLVAGATGLPQLPDCRSNRGTSSEACDVVAGAIRLDNQHGELTWQSGTVLTGGKAVAVTGSKPVQTGYRLAFQARTGAGGTERTWIERWVGSDAARCAARQEWRLIWRGYQ